MKKRILCMLLAATMLFGSVPVLADEEDDIRAQIAAAEEEYAETSELLDTLTAEQVEIQSQISDVNAEIVSLMVRIGQAKDDILMTNGRIRWTEGYIEVVKDCLDVAISTKDKQYGDMKRRIQYIYEKGGDLGLLTMILSSQDITTLFNRAEYTNKLHEADRRQLEEYVTAVENVDKTRDELNEQLGMLEEEQSNLVAQRIGLEADEAELEIKLEEYKAQNADYEVQIAEAEKQAEQILANTRAMEAELYRIQEEKRRAAEEEARRKAAEEAARKAAEEARRRSEEEAAEREAAAAAAAAAQRPTSESTRSSREETAASSYSEAPRSSTAEESSYYEDDDDDDYEDDDDEDSYYEEPEPEPEPSYDSGLGSYIVSYACKYIGTPYVWGGNSLSTGVDCSHFVYLVLKNTGAYGGGYTTSGGWAYLGTRVGSLSEARAGDVIVYSGHVAIYDGYGGIVEALDYGYGVVHMRSASCKSIVAIRRFT